MTANQTFAWVASAAALIAVAVGLYLSGPPGEQRLLRIDQQRLGDLQSLAAAIDAYWNGNGALPRTLEELLEARRLRSNTADPVSGAAYAYEVIDADRYRLCATFDRPSQDSVQPDFWAHESGRQCFTISPQANTPALFPGRPPVGSPR